MPRQRRNPIQVGLFIALAAFVLTAAGLYGSRVLEQLSTSLSERYRLEADGLLAEGHLPEAVLTYRQAVEADGQNIRALQALAEAYRQQGRLRMAERYRAIFEKRQPMYVLPDAPIESGLSAVWIAPLSTAVPLGGVFAKDRIISAFEDGTVVAAAIDSGMLLWSVRLPVAATSAPAAGAGLALVGAGDGKLYALELEHGKMVWQIDTGGPVYAAPLLAEGQVYCPSSSGTVLAAGGLDGKILWKRELASPLNGTPVKENGRLFLGANNGRLYALNSADGTLAWPDGILTGGAVESQPVVIENRVIFGSGDGRVYALDAGSGGQYWRASTPDAIYTRPLVQEGRVFVASSGRSLSAVDLITGERIWQTLLPAPLRNTPAAVGNRLFLVGEGSADLFVIDRESGELIAAVPTGDWIAAGPWINGAMLYLLGKDGALLAYRIQ